MKNHLFLLILLLFSCKENEPKIKNIEIDKTVVFDSAYLKKKTTIDKNVLKSITNFKITLKSIKGIKYTANKYSDVRTNNTFLLDSLFSLDKSNFSIKTNSYEFKKKLVFYLHTVKYTNDSISIKSFLENVQGKYTEGYLGERILIFAMKNDKEGNFIDIPANWNHIELKEELLKILYSKIGGDIILCNRTKKCEYKDLRGKR